MLSCSAGSSLVRRSLSSAGGASLGAQGPAICCMAAHRGASSSLVPPMPHWWHGLCQPCGWCASPASAIPLISPDWWEQSSSKAVLPSAVEDAVPWRWRLSQVVGTSLVLPGWREAPDMQVVVPRQVLAVVWSCRAAQALQRAVVPGGGAGRVPEGHGVGACCPL